MITAVALDYGCPFDTHVPLCVAVMDAKTLRTSDGDMPNWREIWDGLMPALNAARTALIWPRVNETVAASTCRLSSVRDDRFDADLSAWQLWWRVRTRRPRRCRRGASAAR